MGKKQKTNGGDAVIYARYSSHNQRDVSIEQQIEALEEFKKAEYIEEWAYELAKLYREAGMMTECLEECDDLILWFSEGQYVYKAMELKMQYKPLTPSQQEKYDKRYARTSEETEEIPDIFSYAWGLASGLVSGHFSPMVMKMRLYGSYLQQIDHQKYVLNFQLFLVR